MGKVVRICGPQNGLSNWVIATFRNSRSANGGKDRCWHLAATAVCDRISGGESGHRIPVKRSYLQKARCPDARRDRKESGPRALGC